VVWWEPGEGFRYARRSDVTSSSRLSPTKARAVIATIIFLVISVWILREWLVVGRPPSLQYLFLFIGAALLSAPSVIYLLRGTALPTETRYALEMTGFVVVVLAFFLIPWG